MNFQGKKRQTQKVSLMYSIKLLSKDSLQSHAENRSRGNTF